METKIEPGVVQKFVNTNSESICWGPEVAVDFESFYEEGVHDIDTLGGWAYNRHPKSHPFLVAVSDGTILWVGHPKNFHWKGLEGRVLCSHNASHDEDVYEAGVEQGRFPRVAFKAWYCTADLSSYLCGNRDLLRAMKTLFDLDISKAVRSSANGKTWEMMEAEEVTLPDGQKTTFAQQMIDYAGDDTVCLRIWKEHGHKWPEREKRLSVRNRHQGRFGVRLNVAELHRCISLGRRVVTESAELLPWVKRGRKQGSTIGIAEECRASNIPCPPTKSGKKGDPELAKEWIEKYSAQLPWVKALKDLRSAKKIVATLEKMLSRVRDDNTMPFSLLYFGAHTGRFAGVGGVNFQNFNREPLFADWDPLGKGIDIRGIIIPREGKKFAVVDLSQIEPRALNYLIGNEALLSQVRAGISIYQAFAQTSSGWKGKDLKKEDKHKYNLAKANVLALGYGAGWKKFITMALQPMYGEMDICVEDDAVALENSVNKTIYLDVPTEVDGKTVLVPEPYDPSKHGSDAKVRLKRFVVVPGPEGAAPIREQVYGSNSRKIVADFRRTNPLITGLWEALDTGLRDAARRKEDFVMELPDGGQMRYRNCRMEKRRKVDKETGRVYEKWEVRCEVGGYPSSVYGGLLTENLCQRFGREVFVEGMLRADAAGLPFLFSVHDEAIFEVDDDGTEVGRKLEKPDDTQLGRCLFYLAQTPEWAPGLPVAAEGVWADRYMK